jgi:hypothetical protein
MPLAVVVLLSVVLPFPSMQQYLSLFSLICLVTMVTEGIFLGLSITKKVRGESSRRKRSRALTVGWYAFTRASQIRKFRVPKPRVARAPTPEHTARSPRDDVRGFDHPERRSRRWCSAARGRASPVTPSIFCRRASPSGTSPRPGTSQATPSGPRASTPTGPAPPAAWTTVEDPDVPRSCGAGGGPLLVDDLATWLTGCSTTRARGSAAVDVSPQVDALVDGGARGAGRVVLVSAEVGLGVVPATRAAGCSATSWARSTPRWPRCATRSCCSSRACRCT